MASLMLDLKDYAVTDTGEVIVKYNYLILDRLLMGESIKGLKTFKYSFAEERVITLFPGLSSRPKSDVEYYNKHCPPERVIIIADLNNYPDGPAPETFDYNLPDQYLSLDLDQYLAEKLAIHFPEMPDAYVERMLLERQMIFDRGMDDLLRALIFIIHTFENNKLVYGIGRGSACASLVLYLIGIHMVDPIEYDIPITEFLRV